MRLQLEDLGSGVEATGVGRLDFGEFFVFLASFWRVQETSQPVAACRAQGNLRTRVAQVL